MKGNKKSKKIKKINIDYPEIKRDNNENDNKIKKFDVYEVSLKSVKINSNRSQSLVLSPLLLRFPFAPSPLFLRSTEILYYFQLFVFKWGLG
jgi:hypothetical protein